MLIKALCDYYDILSKSGKVLPEGYSKVRIHYLISLREDGTMDEIIDCQMTETVLSGKKTKEKKVPVEMQMPLRTEKPGIDANIAEHRPLYIFGLNLEKDGLTPNDRTDKAKKSHKAFVEANLKFIENLHSPIVTAYRHFLESWNPEAETKNPHLLGLGKDYSKSGFAFCLSGSPDKRLHDDPELKERWETEYAKRTADTENIRTGQCAVTGNTEPIARIHSKIKGVYGGLATGNVLISFKNDSENSYGNEQSYNSNISQQAMKKYTEALNYLLGSSNHKTMLDEMTIVFWAMSSKDAYEALFSKLLLIQQDQMGEKQTEKMIRSLLEDAGNAFVSEKRLDSLDKIDPNVDFYMLGLKPNSSRLSVKFMIRRKYADVLCNIARFQQEIQVSDKFHMVALWQIKQEMLPLKSTNEKVDPALMARLFESIIYGRKYPDFLLQTIVRRVRLDSGTRKINAIRAGLIRACINRKASKEEIKVSLDKTNPSLAYRCGRLFAVLEKLQQDASKNTLNRTIKDAYFASASTRPALVFPKLIRLAQNHLNKVSYGAVVNYNRLIGEIVSGLNGAFPESLSLIDQGKFDIGYYEQNMELWKKSEKSEKSEKSDESEKSQESDQMKETGEKDDGTFKQI